MGIGFSRTLAIILGTALPLLGFIRQATTTNADAPSFVIDLVLGIFLLYGAWKVGEKKHTGQRYLAAAWGMTVGVFYYTLAAQITRLNKGELFAVTIPLEWLVVAAGLGLVVAMAGLITSLRSIKKH
jgi:hypothetical protein